MNPPPAAPESPAAPHVAPVAAQSNALTTAPVVPAAPAAPAVPVAKPRASFALHAAAGGALLAVLAAASLATGDFPLSEIWRGVTGDDPLAATTLRDIRLPRLLVTMLAGAALSASGLVMQAFFRNSLASPGLLGVTAGATAGATAAIALGLAAQTLLAVPAAAILGAFAATAAVLALSRLGAGTERLLLSGVALNAILGAVASYALSGTVQTFERNAQILFWLLGGLEGRTWEHVAIAAPVVVCGALLCRLGRPMDLLSAGADEARSLGVDTAALRRELVVLSTVMTALATAVVGPVGFVGLVVPHILRLLLGAENRRLVPWSLAGGAGFLLFCDIVGRHAGNLRIGIVSALLGGPFFLWLLRRTA